MKNSGIEGAYTSVYGEKSVKKIINGKDYERSMRANILASATLRSILLSNIPEDSRYAIDAATEYANSIMKNEDETEFILPENPISDELIKVIGKVKSAL